MLSRTLRLRTTDRKAKQELDKRRCRPKLSSRLQNNRPNHRPWSSSRTILHTGPQMDQHSHGRRSAECCSRKHIEFHRSVRAQPSCQILIGIAKRLMKTRVKTYTLPSRLYGRKQKGHLGTYFIIACHCQYSMPFYLTKSMIWIKVASFSIKPNALLQMI